MKCDAPGGRCYPQSALMEMSYHMSGAGGPLGILAYATPYSSFAELTFVYLPPIEGILNVTANVHLLGTALAHSVDHWYCSAEADLEMTLYCDLFQHGEHVGTVGTNIIDEKHADSTYQRAFNDVFQAPCTAYVSANAPVLITVGAYATGVGQSDYATVDLDFMSPNPQKFILVKSIDYSLDVPS